MSDLKTAEKFNAAMFEVYHRAKKEAGYNATAFLGMLNRDGGLLTAKKLINARTQSDGYTALLMVRRLDLTVEALVVENKRWHPLFTAEELVKAKKRLEANHYSFKEAEDI